MILFIYIFISAVVSMRVRAY